MALTVEDVLARRSRSLVLNANESHRLAPTVAKIMATEMNKSNNWINNEIKDFQELSLRYQLK